MTVGVGEVSELCWLDESRSENEFVCWCAVFIPVIEEKKARFFFFSSCSINRISYRNRFFNKHIQLNSMCQLKVNRAKERVVHALRTAAAVAGSAPPAA